jgi:hypothetical protein
LVFHPVLSGPQALPRPLGGSTVSYRFTLNVRAPDATGPLGAATVSAQIGMALPGENIPQYGVSGSTVLPSASFGPMPSLNSNGLSGNCVGTFVWGFDTAVLHPSAFVGARFYVSVSVQIGGYIYYANNVTFDPFPPVGLGG